VKRNASQVARTPGAVLGKSFIRKSIELSDAGVPLNGDIELFRVECPEPRAKPRKLTGGKLLDGFFNVFGGCHAENIAFAHDP
jgi:hypothetical protein